MKIKKFNNFDKLNENVENEIDYILSTIETSGTMKQYNDEILKMVKDELVQFDDDCITALCDILKKKMKGEPFDIGNNIGCITQYQNVAAGVFNHFENELNK